MSFEPTTRDQIPNPGTRGLRTSLAFSVAIIALKCWTGSLLPSGLGIKENNKTDFPHENECDEPKTQRKIYHSVHLR